MYFNTRMNEKHSCTEQDSGTYLNIDTVFPSIGIFVI